MIGTIEYKMPYTLARSEQKKELESESIIKNLPFGNCDSEGEGCSRCYIV